MWLFLFMLSIFLFQIIVFITKLNVLQLLFQRKSIFNFVIKFLIKSFQITKLKFLFK